MFKIFSTYICWIYKMQRLEVSGAVRPLKGSLGVKGLIFAYCPSDSSVGIATRCGLDGPGIESRCRRDFFAPVQTCPVTHSASCTKGTGSFPEVKRSGRGVKHPPPFNAKLKKEYIYTHPPRGLRGLFWGDLHLYLTPLSVQGINKTGKQRIPVWCKIHSYR